MSPRASSPITCTAWQACSHNCRPLLVLLFIPGAVLSVTLCPSALRPAILPNCYYARTFYDNLAVSIINYLSSFLLVPPPRLLQQMAVYTVSGSLWGFCLLGEVFHCHSHQWLTQCEVLPWDMFLSLFFKCVKCPGITWILIDTSNNI